MRISNEIERAIKYLNAKAPVNSKISGEAIESLVIQTIADLENDKYNFTNSDSVVLKQGDKKRYVRMFKPFSIENILCQYIKQILDRRFTVKYPNRNKMIHTLFDLLKAVKQMSEFTIIKFDFKNYFNSVSSSYVFEKCIKAQMTDRAEEELVYKFTTQTKYSYAGLNTSNLLSEIIALEFDKLIQQNFSKYGLLFHERYIDDTIVILNQHLNKTVCDKILNEALDKIYHDVNISVDIRCKTKFNPTKFRVINRRCLSDVPEQIDFLGYEFFFLKGKKTTATIQYGITSEKREKYDGRLDDIIADYKINDNLELLRHRILAFSSRTVYLGKKYNRNIWKVKGFINNYGELRFLLDTNLLHDDTKDFLKNMIESAFSRNDVPFPYFLGGSKERPGYNLWHNMAVNRTLLLVEYIGYDKKSLEKLCAQVGISFNEREYGALVRDYLIEMKVGF